MELQEAKKLLDICERQELRDHAFGDREVFWTFMGEEVAGGYFGPPPTNANVWINTYPGNGATLGSFVDAEAYELVKCGKLKHIERNDMQGDNIPNYRGA